MKYTLRLFLCLILYSCNAANEERPKEHESIAVGDAGNNIAFHRLEKMSVTGDFDGDGQRDTLIQGCLSGITGSEIDSSPDPFKNDWDTVVAKWFYTQEANVYLMLKNNLKDTLFLGVGQGLYCLINLGDINNDTRDEVALVVDYCDHSQLNTCQIYTFCDKGWGKLKSFKIHEGSFEYLNGNYPKDYIRNSLEKKNGLWYYAEYLDGYEEVEWSKLTYHRCK